MNDSSLNDSPRRKARELVLQALYASAIEEVPPAEIVERVIADPDMPERHLEFARQLFHLTMANQEWADKQISALARNWAIERLADIDKIIMRMALVEIKEMPDTPVKVAINEAIELAKRFSTSESSSFINGILDSFVKSSEYTQQG